MAQLFINKQNNVLKVSFLIFLLIVTDWLVDFNGIRTRVELFLCLEVREHVHRMLIFTFWVYAILNSLFFFTFFFFLLIFSCFVFCTRFYIKDLFDPNKYYSSGRCGSGSNSNEEILHIHPGILLDLSLTTRFSLVSPLFLPWRGGGVLFLCKGYSLSPRKLDSHNPLIGLVSNYISIKGFFFRRITEGVPRVQWLKYRTAPSK